MSISMSRGPVHTVLRWSPALPVLMVLLLASCATLPVNSPPSSRVAPVAAGRQGVLRATASSGSAPSAVPLAVDRPETDLLAHAVPVAPAPVQTVNMGDLPTPPLPRMLNVPLIPPPPIIGALQPSSREATPRLGPVRIVAPSPPSSVAASGSSAVGPMPVPSVPGAAPSGSERATQSTAPVANTPPATSPVSAAAAPPAASAAVSAPRVSSSAGSTGARAPASEKNPPPASTPGGATGQTGAARPTAAGSAVAARSSGGGATLAPRIVYAKVGDDITVALDGGGWTFTGGGGGSERWKAGVRYESRSPDSTGTTFVFKAKALGTWRLGFQQQNVATGASAEQIFDVHVLTAAAFDRTIGAKRAASSSSGGLASAANGGAAAANGELAAADWLYKEGKYREALGAYEKAWQPQDPSLTEKIAELAYRVGRYALAREYWQKNFSLSGTQYGDLAVAGLMKTATAQKDAPELRALFDYVRSLKGVSIRHDLLDAGRFLYHENDWKVALSYLDEYLNRYHGRAGADVANFLLGKIYSGPTPMQDAQKALDYFLRVVNDYPTSDYYDRAKANIVYLNRQYFQIR